VFSKFRHFRVSISRRVIVPLWATLTGIALGLTACGTALPVRSPETSVPVSATASTPGAVTAFVDVTVIPMDRERRLPHSTVLVRGDRITAIGPVSQVPVPRGAHRIDARGLFLIPGLADMHLHLETTDEAQIARTFFFLLANGVTTVRDPAYMAKSTGKGMTRLDGADLLALRDRVATGALEGPRIYTSGLWKILPETASIAQQLTVYKAAGYDFLKIRDEQSVSLVDSIAAVARPLGIPIIGHVPDTMGVAHALTIYTSIEHLTGYLILSGDPHPHDAAADARFLATLPRLASATQHAGVWNCPTLVAAEVLTVIPADTLTRWPEVRYVPPEVRKMWADVIQQKKDYRIDLRRQIVLALQRAGAGLLLGTDTPAPYMPYLVPGFSVHRELQALVRAGLTPYEALVTGTRNVATYFGTLAETGTLAEGKRADLVLLAGDPLLDIANTMHIAGVMYAGHWLGRRELDRRMANLAGVESDSGVRTRNGGERSSSLH
jgi:imidazolonepropionase-like amidohydrolase